LDTSYLKKSIKPPKI